MIRKRRKRRRKGHYERGVHVSPKAGECKYRSGWERRYMEWLDANSSVISYKYEGMVIEYVSNVRTGRKRKYYPDFYVEYADRRELVEIKPSKRLAQAKVQKKLSAAYDWCRTAGATFLVMTEVQLKELGILR